MQINRYILQSLLILSFTLSLYELSGQSFTMEEDFLKADMAFDQNVQTVQLCGLTPGKAYGFQLTSGDLVRRPTGIFIKGGSALKGGINPYFFQANQSCVSLTVQIKPEYNKGIAPVGFTAWCRDCKKDNESDDRSVFVTPAPLEFLVKDILMAGAGCWDVRNISSYAQFLSLGLYSGYPGPGIGVIMSTGIATDANPPNNSPNVGTDFGGWGDIDLTAMFFGSPFTYDLCNIEFDFTAPAKGFLQFWVVFASEEYPTGNCDAFGVFASGPGISGPFSGNSQNFATVPNTSDYINACTVNETNNSNKYIDHFDGKDTQYDGFTIAMPVRIPIEECGEYHVNFKLADMNDGLNDSAVFIEGKTFGYEQTTNIEVVVPSTGSNVAYEECSDAFLRICRGDPNQLYPELYIDYTILPGSTAIPGVDYQNLPPNFMIPAGEECVDIPLTLIGDQLLEGDETIQIELESSCPCGSSTAEVIIREAPELDFFLADVSVCQDDVLFHGPEILSGVPNYTYQWSDGSTGAFLDFEAIDPGAQMYSVTITDECGRSKVDSGLVEIFGRPTATMEGDGALCVGSTKDTIFLKITFGPPSAAPWNLSYYLNGILQPPLTNITQSPVIIPVTSPGFNQIENVWNNSGCSGYIFGESFIEGIKVESELDSTAVSCFGAKDGTITALGQDGIEPYTYLWSEGGQTGAVLDSIGVGQYFVTISDAMGCLTVDSITMTSQTDITVTGVLVNGTACQAATGAVDITIVGGTLPYTYKWNNGSSAEDPTNLPEGVAIVTVTDDRGCESYASFDIPVPAAPSVSATAFGTVTCAAPGGGSAILDITGGTMPFTFQWSGNGGNQQNPTGLTGGTYTVTVTDDAGCVATDTIFIPVDTLFPIAVTIPTDTLTCGVTSLLLNGAGSTTGPEYTYLWTTGNGQILSGSTTLQPEIGLPGTYSLLVTNTTNGCTATASVQVLPDLNAPTIQISPADTLSCNVSTIVLDASGSSSGPNIQISWTTTTGQILSGGSTLQPTVGATGTYTLILTNTSNNCVATADIIVPGLNVLLQANIATPDVITCDAPQITLDGIGSTTVPGTTFNWSTISGSIVGGSTGPTVQVNAAGVYTLVLNDPQSGCADTVTVTVTADQINPLATGQVSGVITCLQTDVTLDGNGSSSGPNIQYQWTTSNGNLTGPTQAQTTNANAPGAYTLLVTNTLNGCTAQTTVNVQIDTLKPQANAGATDQIDCQNPIITLQGNGQTFSGPATITWTTTNGNILNGATSFTPQVNQGGIYQLLITDNQNGCTAQSTVTISENFNLPNVIIAPPAVLTCALPETILDATNSVSGPQITIQWTTLDGLISSGAGTHNPTIAEPGSYTLLLVDLNNGCRDSLTVTVSENKVAPLADAGLPEQIACLGDSALLDGSGSSSGPNFTHDWYLDLLAAPTISNQITPHTTLAGTYTLVVTNQQNGCRDSSTVTIPSDFLNNAVLTLIDKVCNDQVSDLEIGPVAGGVLPYLYSIDDGITNQVNPVFPKLGPGIYPVVVTDAKGCTWRELIEVPVEEGILIDLPADLTITLSEEVRIEALINIDPATITSLAWYPPYGLNRTDSLVVFASPDLTVPYTVTIIDERGCLSRDTITIVVHDPDIFVPSAFTPYNGDGVNDKFMIFAGDVGILQVDRFEVYSRWGERLFLAEEFQPNDPNFGWDGMQENKELNPGVFVYYAEIRFTDGRIKTLKGEVLLMR